MQRFWPSVGGAELLSLEICRRLAAAGHSVTVATTNALDFEYFWDQRARALDRPAREVVHGLEVLRFPVRHLPASRLAFPAVRRLTSLLSTVPIVPSPALEHLAHLTPLVPALQQWLSGDPGTFDIVAGMSSICFESLLLPGQRFARRRGIPFVICPLTHLGIGDPRKDRVGRYYTMRHQLELIRRSDAVIALTEREAQFYAGQGVPTARIVVRAPGVDPVGLAGGDGERFRAKYRVDEPIVFFIGAMAHDKGVFHLVAAMRRLWAKGIPARLVLAGAVLEPMRRFWLGLPRECQQRILLLDSVSEADKLDLLAAGDVFAMPSRTDAFGIVYLEAWSYAKPVIGAVAGGVPEVIRHEQDGLLVPFADVPALADSIERLLRDRALAHFLGERGRIKVLAEYTWDKTFAVVNRLYMDLTGNNGSAASTASTPVST